MRENVLQYLDWFASEVGVVTQEDWYDVNPMVLKELSGDRILEKYGAFPLMELLETYYPGTQLSSSMNHCIKN